ncbi:MAG: hypothetical protein Q8P48_03995, partial [Deltaproteobacteria bacterium]|nr:hypothetical protein [Deltaproteobacteria bacterium]
MAFLELKLKKNFKELQQKTKKFAETADGLDDDNICNERGCHVCDDKAYLLSKFHKEALEYLTEKTKGLHSNGNDSELKDKIRDAWKMSRSRWGIPLSFFHRKVVLNGIDRGFTIVILGIVTLTLCAITFVDSNIYVFHSDYGLSVGVWNTVLYLLLVFSIGFPVLFWQSWRKLLCEYECLSILHVKARDAKIEQTIEKVPLNKVKQTIQELKEKIDSLMK